MLVTDVGRYLKIAVVTVNSSGSMSVGTIIQPFTDIDHYHNVKHVFLYPFPSNPNRYLLHIYAEDGTSIDWAVVLTINNNMVAAAKPMERSVGGFRAAGWIVSDTVWARQPINGTRPIAYLHTIGSNGEIQEYTNNSVVLSNNDRILQFGPAALIPLGRNKYIALFGGEEGSGRGINGIYYTIVTYNGQTFDVVRDTTLLDSGVKEIGWGGEWTKVGTDLITFICADSYSYRTIPRQNLISVDARSNTASAQGLNISHLEAGYVASGLSNLMRATPNTAGFSNVVLPMLGSSINVEHLYRSEVYRGIIPAASRIGGISSTKCTKGKPGSIWKLA